MINPKNKITSKLVISYIIALVFTLLAFMLFYRQLIRLSESSNQSIDFNEHVFLISETITDLYEVESLGRNLIKKSTSKNFKKYHSKVNKINSSMDELILKYQDTSQRIKINSIKDLLRRKNININQLIKIYKKKRSETYYATALKELEKIDPTFKDYSYKDRFDELEDHQREYLINLLEYSKLENQDNLSNKTIDSIATSVTNVLLKLSERERLLQKSIEKKENEIIENDRILTSKIRSMLTAMEFEELKLYGQKTRESKQILSQTYKIMLFSTLLTLLLAITFLYLINRDVNRDSKNRLELEESKNYSEKLVKNRESLINMVTHDIRAPLNTIMGFLELLENTKVETKSQHYISQMQRSSEYMLHLVNDLLDFSKVEAGKLAVEIVNFQPNLIIENAIGQAIPTKNLKNIRVSTNIDKKLKNLFASDPYRIRQIAVNLIGNAYKFTTEGFIKIDAILEYTNDAPFLKLIISDSGIGIPEEQQGKIFDAFSQNKKSDQKDGFGLGLYITKSLIDLLGGKISLRSELGEGSTFECWIPLQEVEKKEILNPVVISKEASEISVVLIDDEETQLIFLEAILEKHHINYTSFQNVEKALTFIEEQIPSLILTDIQMPIMDGFSLVSKLKSNTITSGIPVIGLTGNSSYSSTEFDVVGFSAHLLKPYKPCHLLQKITTLLNIKMEDSNQQKNNNSSPYKNEDYDLTDLIYFMDDDFDAVKKILNTFYENTQIHVKEWENAIAERNIVGLRKRAHKMYPMFMQIKSIKVAEKLRIIDTEEVPNDDDFYIQAKKIKPEIEKILQDLKQSILI